MKMKDFFPESMGQKRGCALHMAKYGCLSHSSFWSPGDGRDCHHRAIPNGRSHRTRSLLWLVIEKENSNYFPRAKS